MKTSLGVIAMLASCALGGCSTEETYEETLAGVSAQAGISIVVARSKSDEPADVLFVSITGVGGSYEHCPVFRIRADVDGEPMEVLSQGGWSPGDSGGGLLFGDAHGSRQIASCGDPHFRWPVPERAQRQTKTTIRLRDESKEITVVLGDPFTGPEAAWASPADGVLQAGSEARIHASQLPQESMSLFYYSAGDGERDVYLKWSESDGTLLRVGAELTLTVPTTAAASAGSIRVETEDGDMNWGPTVARCDLPDREGRSGCGVSRARCVSPTCDVLEHNPLGRPLGEWGSAYAPLATRIVGAP